MPILHRDDSFATMLLTCALSPDREELVHPLCATEFHELRMLAARTGTPLGQLISMDMSGVMRLLEVDEMTAYRLCILLGRILPLSYMLEGLAEKGVEMLSYCDAEYPAHVKRVLPDSAPPVIYACGDLSLLDRKAISIVGVSGVKLSQPLRDSIHDFVTNATGEGYTIVTGGELGVMHVAENAAIDSGGTQICVVAGDMLKKAYEEPLAAQIANRRALCLSLAHPQSLFTVSHAAARMRFLFALADAVFLLNTDLKRGEIDALRAKCCKWVYALVPDARASTNAFVSRGATAIKNLRDFDFAAAAKNWTLSKGVQMSIFDYLEDPPAAP